MKFAIKENFTILTHDSDYGELIFKYGYKPKAGVIYFRLFEFEPLDPGKILLELIGKRLPFENCLTVVDEKTIRQRSF